MLVTWAVLCTAVTTIDLLIKCSAKKERRISEFRTLADSPEETIGNVFRLLFSGRGQFEFVLIFISPGFFFTPIMGENCLLSLFMLNIKTICFKKVIDLKNSHTLKENKTKTKGKKRPLVDLFIWITKTNLITPNRKTQLEKKYYEFSNFFFTLNIYTFSTFFLTRLETDIGR